MATSLRIERAYRLALFAFLLASWTSGISFFVMDRWVSVEGEFGPQKHPWQFSVLKVHGAAAFSMMIAFGYLLASHVPAGLKTQRRRRSGLILVGAQGFMIFTAYLLYYLGDEVWRQSTSYAHAFVGFCFPFLLITHLMQGRRRRRRKAFEARSA